MNALKQTLTVLGSTGSIGVNTLDVVARHTEQFQVFALTGAKQVDLMLKKARVDQTAKKIGDSDAEEISSNTFDRNELLKMLGKSDK